MERGGVLRTEQDGDRRPPGSPPAVWEAFVAQSRWKSWAIVGLLGLIGLLALAVLRLAARPPEFVMVDAAGHTALVKRSVATDALLKFIGERTRPPELTVVRFTRDFLRLTLGVNSSTIEADWPAALALMTPALRERVGAEAAGQKLVETYRAAQRRTELTVDEIVLEDRTPSLLAVRATISRRMAPLIDGAGPTTSDRVQVELVERIVAATPERPDGLEVEEWRLTPLSKTDQPQLRGAATQEVARGER